MRRRSEERLFTINTTFLFFLSSKYVNKTLSCGYSEDGCKYFMSLRLWVEKLSSGKNHRLSSLSVLVSFRDLSV